LVELVRGTERRVVPCQRAEGAQSIVHEAKAAGTSIVVVEQVTDSIPLRDLRLSFPACIVDLADVAVSIPMFGMANSINVASAAAITLYQLSSMIPRSQ
jgi:hypothetical protein